MKFEYKVFIIFFVLSVPLLLLASYVRQKHDASLKVDQKTEDVKGVVDYSVYPVVQNIAPNSVIVGHQYIYDLAVIDSDTNVNDLSAKLTEAPSWLHIEALTVSGVPTYVDIGTHKVVVQVSDGVNSTFKTFYILVLHPDEVQ